MKKGIHPNWFNNCTVTCACGNSFSTGSTYPTLQVDICSACHPYFTGEMKFVDTQGRVDKFMQKMKTASSVKSKRTKKAKLLAETPQEPAKSYKQLLQEQKNIVKQSSTKNSDKTKSQNSSTDVKSPNASDSKVSVVGVKIN
jgi:large subunit ribosomal protein L31